MLIGFVQLHFAIAHLKRSGKVKQLHSPFVELIANVLRRGAASGELRRGIDPVQLYISIASLSYFYQSNSATLGVIFGRDLLAPAARAARLAHMTDLVLSALRPAAPGALDREVAKLIEFNQKVKT